LYIVSPSSGIPLALVNVTFFVSVNPENISELSLINIYLTALGVDFYIFNCIPSPVNSTGSELGKAIKVNASQSCLVILNDFLSVFIKIKLFNNII
jgi:hypothetical protein